MKNALATFTLACALAGCGLLDAEAVSKRLCVKQGNVGDVPAAPPVSVPTLPMVELRIDLSAAVTDPEERGVEVDILPESISLGSSTGDVNFAGVETAVITVLPPGDRVDLRPVVFRYQRATPAPSELFVIEARPERAVNLADYLVNRELRVGVQFSGVAPQRAWTATLEVCSETRVSVDYWDVITS